MLACNFNNRERSITVFLYHDVNDNPSEFGEEFNLTVSNKLFQKQVNWIQDKYCVISPSDLLGDQALPENPALITFDDGFEGAFENGVKYLDKKGIPSLVFLNMGNIINSTPMISSIAAFLEKNGEAHKELFLSIGLQKPFHLNLTPAMLLKLQQSISDLNMDEIQNYQGRIATVEILNKWKKCKNVFFGNHLYEHWNVAALSSNEFKEHVAENDLRLREFSNSLQLFSFPNGQPNLCFTADHVSALSDLGFKKVFYSSGAVNKDCGEFLLNRMDLTTYEYNTIKLNYRVILTQIKNRQLKRLSGLVRRFL